MFCSFHPCYAAWCKEWKDYCRFRFTSLWYVKRFFEYWNVLYKIFSSSRTSQKYQSTSSKYESFAKVLTSLCPLGWIGKISKDSFKIARTLKECTVSQFKIKLCYLYEFNRLLNTIIMRTAARVYTLMHVHFSVFLCTKNILLNIFCNLWKFIRTLFGIKKKRVSL